VSPSGPSGVPLVASDGAIYWQAVWGGGLIRSTDKGKTWAAPAKGVKNNVIELSDQRLAGLIDGQLVISADAGATWTKFGPPLPFKGSGVVYSTKGKCFYAWQSSEKKNPQAIVRLNVE
jgi:hypothetical protein